MPSTSRRQILTAASVATIGLAGCTAVRERAGDVRRSAPERRVDPDWRPGAGTWAERHYGAAKRRYNPHATPPRTEPEVAWQHELDSSPEDGGLVVADDAVYLATRDRLLALDAADGEVRWEHDIDGSAGLKYVDGRLYQLNWDLQEPDLVARSPDGEERWRTDVSDKIRDVHEQNGYVFVAGRERYRTLHADTGEIVRERDDWVQNVASAGETLYTAIGDILFGYEVGGRTLEKRWEAGSGYPTESGQSVVMGDRIYVPQYRPFGDGDVVVFDSSGAKRRGIELDFRPRHLTVLEDGMIVGPSFPGDGDLFAMRLDGDRRWTADVNGRAEAIAADGTVYAGNPLVALDDESGERLWRRNVVGGAVRLAAADSTLYVAAPGRLLALRE